LPAASSSSKQSGRRFGRPSGNRSGTPISACCGYVPAWP
jgi:hypothetical protein